MADKFSLPIVGIILCGLNRLDDQDYGFKSSCDDDLPKKICGVAFMVFNRFCEV